MATITIRISPATAMPSGWIHWLIVASNTSYSDREKYKQFKMLWDPITKTWCKSGNINTDGDRAVKYLTGKINGAITCSKKISVEIHS